MGPLASDGTFAAGVNHVTELLPALMGDILSVAPEDQKVRSLDTIPPQTSITTALVEYIQTRLRGGRGAGMHSGAYGDLLSKLYVLVSCIVLYIVLKLTSLLALLGQDKKTDRNLGAWKHISSRYAEQLQREIKCPKR